MDGKCRLRSRGIRKGYRPSRSPLPNPDARRRRNLPMPRDAGRRRPGNPAALETRTFERMRGSPRDRSRPERRRMNEGVSWARQASNSGPSKAISLPPALRLLHDGTEDLLEERDQLLVEAEAEVRRQHLERPPRRQGGAGGALRSPRLDRLPDGHHLPT